MQVYRKSLRDDPDWDFDEIPLAACGNVEDSFLRSMNYTESQSVPLSHNENWRDGLAVTLMGKFIIQFEMLCDVRQTYCVLRLPAPKSTNVESSWCKFALVKGQRAEQPCHLYHNLTAAFLFLF
jgi:hypothetical protein